MPFREKLDFIFGHCFGSFVTAPHSSLQISPEETYEVTSLHWHNYVYCNMLTFHTTENMPAILYYSHVFAHIILITPNEILKT